MTKEKGCLSGGRYCVIDTEYRQNELVKETLRQICLRKEYDSHIVIKYLWGLKQKINQAMKQSKWQSGLLEEYSWQIMKDYRLNTDSVRTCYNDSFKLVGSNGK